MRNKEPRNLTQRLLSSGIWAIIGRVTAILSLLINYRLVCHVVPEEQVAVYVVAVGIAGLGSLVCGAGLGSVLLRRLSWARQYGDAIDCQRLLRLAIGMATISWVLFSVSLLVALYFYPDFFRRPVLPVVGVLIGWIAARCLLTLVTEALRGLQLFWLAALSGGQQEGPIVNLLITVLLVALGDSVQNARQILVIHLSVTVVATTLFLAIGIRSIRSVSRLSLGTTKAATLEPNRPCTVGSLLGESMKVLVSQLSIFGVVELETLLVGRYCNDIEVGAWGAIRRLISLVSAPLLMINAAIPSFVAELHSQGDKQKLERLLRAASTVSSPPAILGFVFLYLFGDNVLAFIDPSFAAGWSSLAILAAANIVFVAAGSAGLALRMTDKQGLTTVTTILLAVAYLIVAPMAISRYGLLGAATMASIMIIFRNVIATMIVRVVLGIWCIPSRRVDDIRQLAQQVFRKRKSKCGGEAIQATRTNRYNQPD